MRHDTRASPGPQEPAPSQLLDIVCQLLRSHLWHNSLFGHLLEELEEVHSRQQRLYELLTPRFNSYFRDDSQARMAWECVNILRGTPDALFPGDLPSAREDERDAI